MVVGVVVMAVVRRLTPRNVLHRRWCNGACMHEILAVGTEDAVAELIVRTRRVIHNVWWVTGACTPSGVAPASPPLL